MFIVQPLCLHILLKSYLLFRRRGGMPIWGKPRNTFNSSPFMQIPRVCSGPEPLREYLSVLRMYQRGPVAETAPFSVIRLAAKSLDQVPNNRSDVQGVLNDVRSSITETFPRCQFIQVSVARWLPCYSLYGKRLLGRRASFRR